MVDPLKKRGGFYNHRVLFWAVLFAGSYLLSEFTAFYFLNVFESRGVRVYHPGYGLTRIQRNQIEGLISDRNPFMRPDPFLGWSLKPTAVDPEGRRTNSDGIKTAREFSKIPAADRIRIAAFGDSFTYGSDVSDEESWTEQLAGVDAHLEVLNFGVAGYGLDQAYLRYRRDGIPYHPHLVLIGLMSGDLRRHVNVFLPWYTSRTTLPLSKPRFVIEEGRLVPLKNPLEKIEDYRRLLENPRFTLEPLGRRDYFFQKYKSFDHGYQFSPLFRLFKTLKDRPPGPRDLVRRHVYNTESEAFLITEKLVDDFYKEAIANRAVPVILLFPSREDLKLAERGGPKVYAPLLAKLLEERKNVLDLADVFLEKISETGDLGACFGAKTHYSVLGNRWVAEAVHDYLTRNDYFEAEKSKNLVYDKP